MHVKSLNYRLELRAVVSGLQSCSELGKHELQVLGLLGKLLTGSWMIKLYTSAQAQINHMDGIGVVHSVVQKIKSLLQNPAAVLTCTQYFFGNELPDQDTTLNRLRQAPNDLQLFSNMVKACLTTIVEVLMRHMLKWLNRQTEMKDPL